MSSLTEGAGAGIIAQQVSDMLGGATESHVFNTGSIPPTALIVGKDRALFMHLGVQSRADALAVYDGWNNPIRDPETGEEVNAYANQLKGASLSVFDQYLDRGKEVLYAGHSLGGMVVPLLALYHERRGVFPVGGIITYGSPRFTTKPERYEVFQDRMVRFMNQEDLVPRLPPILSDWPAAVLAASALDNAAAMVRFVNNPGLPGAPACFTHWPNMLHLPFGVVLLGGLSYLFSRVPLPRPMGFGAIGNLTDTIANLFQIGAHAMTSYGSVVGQLFPPPGQSLPPEAAGGDWNEIEGETPDERPTPQVADYLIIESDGGLALPTPERPIMQKEADAFTVKPTENANDQQVHSVFLAETRIADFATRGRATGCAKKLKRFFRSFQGNCTVTVGGTLNGWGTILQEVGQGITPIRRPPTVEA
jgi:pimeloyl-ACP methyl ester carboxylesterase